MRSRADFACGMVQPGAPRKSHSSEQNRKHVAASVRPLFKEPSMQLGMIGLGRMGSNMVKRLIKAGHECVVYARRPGPVNALVEVGAVGSTSLEDLVSKLDKPRAVWLMIPAASVDGELAALTALLDKGDIIID